jgi:hypothetical protein
VSVHEVAIVVDPEFAERLRPLAARMHVWVMETPGNRGAIERVAAESAVYSFERGVTSFGSKPGETSASRFCSVLADVDVHHGWYSHDPPWTIVHCFGVDLSDSIQATLAAYGVDQVREEDGQLIAVRPLPPVPN